MSALRVSQSAGLTMIKQTGSRKWVIRNEKLFPISSSNIALPFFRKPDRFKTALCPIKVFAPLILIP